MIIEQSGLDRIEESGTFTKDIYLSLLNENMGIYLNAWGSSMYPLIKNGDKIKIVSVKPDKIKVGDIVAVDIKDSNEAWVFVHRVVKILDSSGKRLYFTKGDAYQKGIDGPIPIELIVGKIVEIRRSWYSILFK